MAIDSIIFDLDGTLWDSIEGICISWNEVLSNYPKINKKITTTELEKCMGLTVAEIGNRLFPELDKDMQMKLMIECNDAEYVYLGEHGGKLYPKLEETLKQLSEQYKLFIVSNCLDGYIQCFLKAHNLGKYFTDFDCSGVTGLTKGETNKLVMKRNHLKSPIYVGDTLKDAESAEVAKIPFVYASYGFGTVENYDYVIDRFEELLTLDFNGNRHK